MDRQIDIWDQPFNSSAILVAAGVQAMITGVDSTSESPVSTVLGQAQVWPRLLGQDVAHVTHKVVIPYIAGLRSRMYIIYNDADVGERRFEIDRIVDPDERKHELRILAIERNDGIDPFDAYLTTTADVLARDTLSGDDYGLSDPSFITLDTGVACRVSMSAGVQKGREVRAKSNVTVTYAEVFMRPWFNDPAPNGAFVPYEVVNGTTYNTQPLSHDHWLRIPSSTSVNENQEPVPGDLYDITDIDNPGFANHHIEVWCELVLT
jgi:hypothetical protein